MKKWIMGTIFLAICCFNQIHSQESFQKDTLKNKTHYEIELNDGSSLVGIILSRDSSKIVFQTSSIAKIEIPNQQIKSLHVIKAENLNKGTYWTPNPLPSRYFFSPSAINLHKNEGYYQNSYIVLNSFNYGITDYMSIAIGGEIISPFVALSTHSTFSPVFYVSPKVGFKVTDRLYLGGGILFANLGFIGVNTINTIELGYGLATYGSSEHNITFSVGNGFFTGTYESQPVITISGMTRVSKRIALVTENWIVPSRSRTSKYDPITNTTTYTFSNNYAYYPVYSYGMRFIANKISVDLGFINNQDIIKAIFIGIPYAGFSIKF